MDEPTSALDKDAAAKVERLTGELTGRGLAVVLVTHNLEQAARVAEGAFLLLDGRIVASGTPEEIAGAWPEQVTG
jgi:ABC-type phosphate transport system ATPase subunit